MSLSMSRSQIAYEAYARHTGGKTYDGRDMPAWDDLGDRIQGAWQAAADAMVTVLIGGDEPTDDAEAVARAFHETYERLAPSHGYRTREASAKPWAEVPADNRALMVAVVAELLGRGVIRR